MSSEGSTVASDCRCNSGFAVTPALWVTRMSTAVSLAPLDLRSQRPTTLPAVCASGKYADVTQLSACKACGSDSTHSPGSTRQVLMQPSSTSRLTHNPVSADECTVRSTYKPLLSNPLTDCLACAWDMVSAAGSDDRLDCRCKEGFREVPADDEGFKAEADASAVRYLASTRFCGERWTPSACRPARPTPSLCRHADVTACVCKAGYEGTVLGRRAPASWDASSQRLAQVVPKPPDTFENETASTGCRRARQGHVEGFRLH